MKVWDMEYILQDNLVPLVVCMHVDWYTTNAVGQNKCVVPQPDLAWGVKLAVCLKPVLVRAHNVACSRVDEPSIGQVIALCECVGQFEETYGVVLIILCLGTQRSAVQSNARCSGILLVFHFECVTLIDPVAGPFAICAVSFAFRIFAICF